jgi:hypothetical protein
VTDADRDRWDERLENWGLWFLTGHRKRSSGVSSVSLQGGATRRSKEDQSVVLVSEAFDPGVT